VRPGRPRDFGTQTSLPFSTISLARELKDQHALA
jgi:hypothetical protein